MNPTPFERLINARINLKIFRWYVGTGHLLFHDTDDELSSDDEDD